MIYKVFKFIVNTVSIIAAVAFLIYESIKSDMSQYDMMILALLCLIAFSAILETFDNDRKWRQVKKELNDEISSITQCRIKVFSSSYDWISAIKELAGKGIHSQDIASLDSTTRSKAPKDHNSIWSYINECCADKSTTFRHIIRIRSNNFDNLLDRIISGNADKKSYFRYYELEAEFSFPTFGIIDDKYVATRSPYQEGEIPQYMIIENKTIVDYYRKYYDDLWSNALEINVSTLEQFYANFKSSYDSKTQKIIENKMEIIRKRGIKHEI